MAFTRRQQAAKQADPAPVAVNVDKEDEPEITVTETPETTATTSEPEVQEIEVAEVVAVVETKLVTIVPRVTLSSTRIGPDIYSFLKGVPVKVPVGVKAHLQEKGII